MSFQSGCADYQRALRASRREALKLGGLGALSLGLPSVLRAEQEPISLAAATAPAKSVILLYCFGGPSHLDMWDMKPDGPSAIRGEFSPIQTALPGTVYCEHLPRLAKLNDRFTIVRSVTHNRNVHGGATAYTLTGTAGADPGIPSVRGPDASLDDHPAVGSAVALIAPGREELPSSVTLPWDMIDGQGRYVPGQNAAMLGGRYDPWFVKSDPNSPDFRVDGLSLQQGLSVDRVGDRQRLLKKLNAAERGVERVNALASLDSYYQKAFSMLTSAETRKAFDIHAEPAALRERYGRNTLGQSCLLARRLVEAGVRLVQVNMANRLSGAMNWDTHADNFNQLKKNMLPKFDPAFSTLLEDLEDRGLLEETLVVCLSEFGRSPKIAANGGRDHWPQCYSVLFAGAGAGRGCEYGASDAQGAYPSRDPVSPADLIATVYWRLGIDPNQSIRDLSGREHPLVKGRPLEELFKSVA